MDGAISSQLVSAAMVVYGLNTLKRFAWYQAFVKALPMDDAHIHRAVSALGAFLSAVGIHIAFTGSAQAGWSFAGTIPPLAILLHGLWDWFQQFVMNQVFYDVVMKEPLMPVVKIQLPSSLPVPPVQP